MSTTEHNPNPPIDPRRSLEDWVRDLESKVEALSSAEDISGGTRKSLPVQEQLDNLVRDHGAMNDRVTALEVPRPFNLGDRVTVDSAETGIPLGTGVVNTGLVNGLYSVKFDDGGIYDYSASELRHADSAAPGYGKGVPLPGYATVINKAGKPIRVDVSDTDADAPTIREVMQEKINAGYRKRVSDAKNFAQDMAREADEQEARADAEYVGHVSQLDAFPTAGNSRKPETPTPDVSRKPSIPPTAEYTYFRDNDGDVWRVDSSGSAFMWNPLFDPARWTKDAPEQIEEMRATFGPLTQITPAELTTEQRNGDN